MQTMGVASDCIHETLYGSNNVISDKIISQISHKILNFGDAPSTESRILCCHNRYTLLLKCLETFIGCIIRIRGATHSIYKPQLVCTMSFLPRLTLKIHTKHQI